MNKTNRKKSRTETFLSVIITTALVLTLAITVANSINKGNINDNNNDNIVDLNETKGALLENETKQQNLPETPSTEPAKENLAAKNPTEDAKSPTKSETDSDAKSYGLANDPTDIAKEETVPYKAVDSRDSVKSNLSFNENSTMYWPVTGDIALAYNMDNTIWFPTLGVYKCSPEIYISCDAGTKISAACTGVVESISEDEVNGTSVTLSVGNGYTVTYGSVDNLKVVKGDLVKTGDSIGYVAEPTIYFTKEGSGLHFAVACDGESVDPMMFLE